MRKLKNENTLRDDPEKVENFFFCFGQITERRLMET